ncbi:hypothetical protein SLEP1_g38125 [Rubroshorea leprosula]|uniref:Uncharacterized protein n=1 Tax=Rubroshorea leprosula TaxID=152421 RepID=A0AAV5KX32_9ROSI|nr:hypothetical protein SLEP1_g38125 [Rubroshorea leprosula]
MANSSGNGQELANQGASSTFFNGTNPTNGNLAPDCSASSLKLDSGIALEWTAEEQAVLEDGLKKYASEPFISRYAKIAVHLPNKTVRDVALRSRWMTKKEISKRRKEEHNSTRKSRDKRERVSDPSAKPVYFGSHTNVPYGSLSTMIPPNYDDDISVKAMGGVTGELLQQNAQAINRISTNLASLELEDNINLFCQIRSNIFKIMNNWNETSEFMRQMPQLPVTLNEELANNILPLQQPFPNHNP